MGKGKIKGLISKVERTYNILDAIPYWPETGQAQTTCRASLVATLAAVIFRVVRVYSSEGIL